MPTHHVYADANVFLDFFRFSDDDLDELQKLSDQIGDDKVALYLPQLTAEEYFRNRDKVVLDQLEGIKRHQLKVGIPIFIRDSESSKKLLEHLAEANLARNEVLKDAEQMASSRTFRADKLIEEIFSKAKSIPTTPALLDAARARMSLGNPPRKSGAIGDRLNWESLLKMVPSGNDLYILTRDGDYIAAFADPVPNLFLTNEWKATKSGKLFLYQGIKKFAQLVDDSIVFEFDVPNQAVFGPEIESAIENLANSKSFSWTHSAIADLEQFKDQLTDPQVEKLLNIALKNGQVGGIMTDQDLEEFYGSIRYKLPWSGNETADKFDAAFSNISPF